ncbi:baseplate J/gp47 family protein [Halovivax cerinus]|uniref:Baseplate J/gp47 family protein n=1 Tax=Halovivax cerinus TaxID=1487865 RepID=A0ABD5NQV8_9EURY|nr:baseplate J/gp47 family protein [Halovivax cerinus]
MSGPPQLGDRDQEAVFEELIERADAYTEGWDPQTPDAGRALVRIFSGFEADLRTRLAELPAKHRLAFLDALDFDRRPPQAATAPLSFQVSTDLDRNVAIPAGTQAVAETEPGSPQLFELPQDGGFEATGARITDVVTVDPSADRIVFHDDLPAGDGPVRLFAGDDRQDHALYLGSADALTLDAGSSFSIALTVSGDADRVFDAVEWEYYGIGPDGSAGWHLLDESTEGDRPDEDVGVEQLQERLQSRSTTNDPATADGRRSARAFTLPGPTVEHAVDGTTSRWIRCRRRPSCRSVSATIRSIEIHVGSAEGHEPDQLLANDVPLSPSEPIRPFGRMPHPPATFYVSCEEAFTKPGGIVDLEFVTPDTTQEDATASNESTDEESRTQQTAVVGGPPHLSWEYWNGEGWTRLASVEDETAALTTGGRVSFTVPDDLEPTTVSGHENVWVRCRLVSGSYGRPQFSVTDDGARGQPVSEPDEPVFDELTIHYDRGEHPFETVRRHDNAAYSDDLADRPGSYPAFCDLSDETQTVYFGFDDTVRDGPLTLFVPIEDATYPPTFDTGVQWEYCTDPAADEWESLDVSDRTAGLTERGIVTFTLPTPTRSMPRFGRERHWIRARLTKDEFDRPDASTAAEAGSLVFDGDDSSGSRDGATGSASGADPAPSAIDSAPLPSDSEPSEGVPAASMDPGAATSTTARTAPPPVLDGLHLNTQWAYNTTTIENEILGSSDGSHEQSFGCSHAPLIDVEVWVDEHSALSAGERRRLRQTRPEDVDPEYDARGECTAFWVRWESVSDFLASGPMDRHYVSNRTLGVVQFGDGDAGAIPPAGTDNVRATFTTGGGRDGIVDAGTITTLNSAIALVESVTNPMPADGGADTESTDSLVDRATNRLKHRGRAVTPRDYEQVATAAFPELAVVACDPSLDRRAGEPRVTVLIVPQTEREKPVPSMALKHRVRDVLCERAPASLVADEAADIVVRGPNYCELSVEATVRATAVKSVSQLKRTVEARLDDYLHPLSGDDGTGWAFGELPDAASLAEIVADVEAVADVLAFDVALSGPGTRRQLSHHDDGPSLPRDTLPCSGAHDLTVTVEGDP